MKFLLSAVLFSLAGSLFAVAPLQSGFALAPRAAASQEEKDIAFMEARSRVITAAIKYENTPYLYGGITSSGLDCSGFIYLSFRDALGVNLPRSSSGLYTWSERVSIEDAQAGDLLFFRTDNSGNITHVGLYLGNRRFIHSASSGPETGVIYSSLDEAYWARTFAGAGRVFPEVPAAYQYDYVDVPLAPSDGNSGGENRLGSLGGSFPRGIASSSGEGRLLLGVALAPTFGSNFIRGFTSQLRLGIDTYSFGRRMIFGLELRPEYDGELGVFRLPITVSWGFNDVLRIFGGAVFSFGNASIGGRQYSAGPAWFGTAGITAAPFIFSTPAGEFAPYAEAAWQSYSSDNASFNFAADFAANFRFSTGVRWTIQVN